MAYRPLSAVVLAAGEGTRMRSTRPKPLHVLCGRPMLLHVLDSLSALPLERAVVVVGRGSDPVSATLAEHGPADLKIDFVEQEVPRGTGDAVMSALSAFPDLDDEDDLIVVPGDTPLLRSETLAMLATRHRVSGAGATLLSAEVDDPGGYGRIVRDRHGAVVRIVEAADASDEELALCEVNTSIYCFRRSILAPALRRISPENAQGEYYLTDVIAVLADAGYSIESVVADDPSETSGVNDRVQLAQAETILRRRINEGLLRAGVTMLDPDRTYVDANVTVGPDTTLRPGTMLQGRTHVGAECRIGPDTRLVDCTVGNRCVVEQTSAIEAEIGDGAWVGPFAVLQPGAVVEPGRKTGPFYTAGSWS